MVSVINTDFRSQPFTNKDAHDQHFSRLLEQKLSRAGDSNPAMHPSEAKNFLNDTEYFTINAYMRNPAKSRRLNDYCRDRASGRAAPNYLMDLEIRGFLNARSKLPSYQSARADRNHSSIVVRGIRSPEAGDKSAQLNSALRTGDNVMNNEIASFTALEQDGGILQNVKNYFHQPGSITLIVNTRSGVDISGCDWGDEREITHEPGRVIIPEVGFNDASNQPVYVAHTPQSAPILTSEEMPRSTDADKNIVDGQSWDTIPILDLNRS